MHVAIVTNIPAPYRVPVYNLCAQTPGVRLSVIFLAQREPDRLWDLPGQAFHAEYLSERLVSWRGRYIHFSSGVTRALRALDPDVVITTGFNPSHLAAMWYALRARKPHVPMTDGTLNSEQELSFVHRFVRRWIFRRSSAFVGASQGSLQLYRAYGVGDTDFFQSHLCCDLDDFDSVAPAERPFDMVFSGRFVPLKSPDFVISVAERVGRRLGRRVRVLFLGAGPMLEDVKAQAEAASAWVDAEFHGYASQAELPALYASARMLVFPTSGEPWGVVANEACAAGLPVLATPGAGASGEIVVNGDNGFVLPLDLDIWSNAVARLLADPALCESMGRRSRELVQPYNFANAAEGILRAARHALRQG
jgi:glycosyltransferase involved in cell wall biosynthesis